MSVMPAGPAEDSLRTLLAVPWRRRGIIVAVTGLGLTLALLALVLVTPRYTATALVMVAAPPARVVAMDAVVAGAPADAATVFTEAEVLRSRPLLAQVAAAEGVYDSAEFNDALKPPGPLRLVRNLIPPEWQAVLFGHVPPTDPQAPEARADALNQFRDAVSVTPVHRSRILRLSVESEAPEAAARLANALADAYLTSQLEAKFEVTRKATAWLDERLSALRAEVRVAEAAVTEYRAAHDLAESQGTPLTAQQMAELNSKLILAKSQRSEAEARLAAARRGTAAETVPEVLKSPVIQALKAEEAQAQRQVSELSTRYGEKHPRMIDARARLAEVRGKIGVETRAVIAALENEARVARAREASLAAGLDEVAGQDAQEDAAAITLRELEREAEATRLMYETILTRFKEATQQQSLQEPDSRIVAAAGIPVEPSSPRRLAALAAAGAVSLAAGVALAFLRERLDRAVRSNADAVAAVGVPVLGMIPRAPGRSVADATVDAPAEAAAEAVRTLRATLAVRARGQALGVVTVTSALPDEGKSTLALWLARASAGSGRATVLVDGDLRRPGLAATLGLPPGPTLPEVLAGTAALDSALVQDPRSPLMVLPGGRAGTEALDLAETEAMADLLAALKSRFDTVIVDAPPVLAVADGRVLARRADHVLYALRWNVTTPEAAAEGARALAEAGATPLPVITRVDLRKHGRYGYGDAASVYGRYATYYGGRG